RHTSFSSPPFSLTPPPPPRSPLFPYTTLFRSSATWSARTTPRSSASKTSYPLPKGNPRAFHAPPGSCHAIPAPHLPFSNLEPSDQIVSSGERDCAAAMASGPGSTSILPGNWWLVVCIVLSKPSDGSVDRVLANCRARC